MDDIACPKCRLSDVNKRKTTRIIDNVDEVIVSDFLISANNPAGITIADHQLGLTLYECNKCGLIFGIGEIFEKRTISTVDKFKHRLQEREKARNSRSY